MNHDFRQETVTMSSMKKTFLPALAALTVMVSASVANAQQYGDEYRDQSAFGRMQHKLGRGLSNLLRALLKSPRISRANGVRATLPRALSSAARRVWVGRQPVWPRAHTKR